MPFRETQQQAFDAHAVDTWSLGTTLFMALLGVQPWEEVGDYKFQAIAEGKNLDVVLEGWKLRDAISDEAVDLLQVGGRETRFCSLAAPGSLLAMVA